MGSEFGYDCLLRDECRDYYNNICIKETELIL